jgi:Tfp pilus assembly protein PilE
MISLKNNKGVTMVILIITIIVMLIIFGITYNTANDLLRNSQKNRLRTNLYLIQSRASALLEDYLFYYDEDAAAESQEAKDTKKTLGTELTNSSDYASYNWSIKSRKKLYICKMDFR